MVSFTNTHQTYRYKLWQTESGRETVGCSGCVCPWRAAISPQMEWTAIRVTKPTFSSRLVEWASNPHAQGYQRYVFVQISTAGLPPRRETFPVSNPQKPTAVLQVMDEHPPSRASTVPLCCDIKENEASAAHHVELEDTSSTSSRRKMPSPTAAFRGGSKGCLSFRTNKTTHTAVNGPVGGFMHQKGQQRGSVDQELQNSLLASITAPRERSEGGKRLTSSNLDQSSRQQNGTRPALALLSIDGERTRKPLIRKLACDSGAKRHPDAKHATPLDIEEEPWKHDGQTTSRSRVTTSALVPASAVNAASAYSVSRASSPMSTHTDKHAAPTKRTPTTSTTVCRAFQRGQDTVAPTTPLVERKASKKIRFRLSEWGSEKLRAGRREYLTGSQGAMAADGNVNPTHAHQSGMSE